MGQKCNARKEVFRFLGMRRCSCELFILKETGCSLQLSRAQLPKLPKLPRFVGDERPQHGELVTQ